MKPYDIICELVKDNFLYTSQPKIENLLPIDTVFDSYGLGGGVMPIVFEPPEDYGEGYRRRCNTSNSVQRIQELNAVNEDIEKYNAWARKKNKDHMAEVWVALPPDGNVHDVSTLNIKTKHYPTIRKHELWANGFRIATPSLSNPPTKINIVTIDDEALYHLKENLDADEFVQRFNAGIFAYIQDRIKQEKDLDAWGEDSVWYNPNKEFAHWFSSRGLDVSKIEHFDFVDDREKDIWDWSYLDMAQEARELKEKGDFDTYTDAYQYMIDGHWFQKKGNPCVDAETLDQYYRSAKSKGNKNVND
jgi:hypothetical protein